MSGHGSAQQHSSAAKERRALVESDWLDEGVVSSTSLYFPEDPDFQDAIPEPVTAAPVEPDLPSKAPNRGRKSKTQALEKLSNFPQEATVKHEPVVVQQDVPHPSENPARKAWTKPLAPPFDLNSVCLKAPADFPTRDGETRPFGLKHCPVFRPSPEEFARPMEYLEKVARESTDDYGIAKIIPPDGWKPPFSLNSEVIPAGKNSGPG
jgi:hypothetical protein